MAKRRFTIDQAQVAYLFGVDSRSILNWSKRDIDPLPVAKQTRRGQPNQYDPAELVQWYVRNELAKLDIGDGEVLSLEAERAKLTRLQSRKAELDLAEREGELVNIDEVTAVMSRMIAECKRRLLSIPTRAAPLVKGAKTLPKVRDILKKQIHDALRDLAGIDPNMFLGTGSAGAQDTAGSDEK